MVNGPEDAVSSTFAFVVAVGVMLSSVAVVYQATGDIASPGVLRETEQVNLQSEAAALKGILLNSPGVVTGGGAWDQTEDTADTIERLGLLSPDGAGIQLEKLRNLRLAPFEANATDGYANYEEVKTALGLDDKGLDFHIRAKPTLKNVEEILDDPSLRDQQLKVTYIGNVSSKSSSGTSIDGNITVDDFTCEASPASTKSWRFSINVTNGGTTATQFFAVFDINNGGTVVTRQDQGTLLAAGDRGIIHVDVENTDEVDCTSSTTAEVDLLDPVQLLRTQTVSGPMISGSPALADDTFYTNVGVPYTTLSGNDDVEINYYGTAFLDEDGEVITSHELLLEVREGTDPSGTLKHSDSAEVKSNTNQQRFKFDASSDLGPAGEYTAYLKHVPSGIVATQRIVILADEPDAYAPDGASGTTSWEEDPAMQVEIGFLHDLAEQFCPAYFDTTTVGWDVNETWNDRCGHFKTVDPLWDGTVHSGDVLPDLQKELWGLEAKLLKLEADGVTKTPRYDLVNTLVVGSNVAHNSMTSNNFGDPLEQWVLGGGTLIVFGSPGQSTQWLQNLFHAGQTSSSGGISAPDVSHPLLSTPEQLSYEDYDTSGKGWKYTGGADEHFTDVVEQGGTPVTAISDPGDFGEGTIVLTSWLPYDLFGTGTGTAGMEGLRLMYNFMMQGYRDLFLDYGPPLPDGVPAIPAAGRSYVDHPDLGQLTLDFTLYVFPST